MPLAAAEELAASLKMPLQNLTIALVLFSAYPLAWIYARLPKHAATAKHIFSIAITSALFLSLVDVFLYFQLLGAALLAYVVVAAGRQSQWTPVGVFLGILGLLSYHHLNNQIINPDPDRSDNTGPVMMMVIKLSTFAWAAHDGTKPKEALTTEQRRTAIHHMPTLLEFLGYAFFFGGWLVGPANDFSEYRRFTRGEPPFDHIPPKGFASLRTFLMGMLTLGIYIQFDKPLSHWYIIEDEFMTRSFFYRLMYINLAGNIVRCKYYGVWKLAEGACNLSGIGYLGPCPSNPQKQIFARVQNVEPLTVERAQSPREYIGGWNQQTGKWLRNCIYVRLSPVQTDASKAADVAAGRKPKKPSTAFANMATYLASAIWHGFRPGYYFCFLSGGIVTITGQILRRNLRPLVIAPSRLALYKPIYDFLGWLLTQISLNYICAPFPVYWVANGLRVWSSVYYIVHIWNFAAIVFFSFFGGGAVVRRVGRTLGVVYPGRGGGGAPHAAVNGVVNKSEAALAVEDEAAALLARDSDEVREIKSRERAAVNRKTD
ncbi:lysophospholipid acyltransferase [Geranomyces variabilis]|nr:lysophospholipid acyltransferase [Geranomyces variabilis]